MTASCFKVASFSQAKINRKKLSATSLRLKRRFLYGKCQAITGKVNLHLYHYAGVNPLKYTDPDGKMTEDEVAAASAALQNGAVQNKLSDLVDIKNLSKIIATRATELDDKTAAYVMGLGSTMKERAAAVEKILAEVKVYSGVNKQKLNNVVSQFADMPSIDGLSVGNAIYMAGSIPASMDSFTADLLGHEAIHSIQAAAYGGTTAFLNAYIPELRTNQYSTANKFEYAAYAFGGSLQFAGFTLPFPQILSGKGAWWR